MNIKGKNNFENRRIFFEQLKTVPSLCNVANKSECTLIGIGSYVYTKESSFGSTKFSTAVQFFENSCPS